MNIQHSSRTDMWFTPLEIILMVHEVLGTVDFDPASCIEANARIQAKRFLCEEEDGLSKSWGPGSVFLNPPGGKRKNKSISALFWRKLMEHAESPIFAHGIFMGFSVEQLAVTQKYHKRSMLDFPICIPSDRIAFYSPYGEKNAPSHSNVIVYIPGASDMTDKFVEVFSKIGKCKV